MGVTYKAMHVYKVIVGLSKSFSKHHNAETSMEQV